MLLLTPSVSGLFKWRQFEPEVILLAVGWYLRFSLSYRDVEEFLAERGLLVDHVTVWRRVTPKTPVFCSYEFKDRTRDKTTAIRIREAGIPSSAQGLQLTVRAPLASHVHTLMLAKTELCLIAVSEVA